MVSEVQGQGESAMLYEERMLDSTHTAQSEATSGELSLPGTPQRSAVSLQASLPSLSHHYAAPLTNHAKPRPLPDACHAHAHHARSMHGAHFAKAISLHNP